MAQQHFRIDILIGTERNNKTKNKKNHKKQGDLREGAPVILKACKRPVYLRVIQKLRGCISSFRNGHALTRNQNNGRNMQYQRKMPLNPEPAEGRDRGKS